MMAILRVNTRWVFLVGVLVFASCRQALPAALQVETAAPTPQPVAAVPEPQASTTNPERISAAVSPTVEGAPTLTTNLPFEVPGGRILFAPFPKTPAEGEDPNIWCTQSFQYSWLHLPSLRVGDHPFLTGEYPTMDFSVSPSPDLSHLAFVRQSLTGAGVDPCHRDSVNVFLARPDDDEFVQAGQPFSGDYVTDNRAAGDGLSWSANSRAFAWVRAQDWLTFEPEKQLYLYDLPSGTSKTLTIPTPQPSAFALSPDGAQVAFTDLGANPGLSLIDADGSNQRMIVEGWVSGNLVWHPEGNRIFYVSDRPEIAIYSVDVFTGAINPITPRSEEPFLLNLSPNGRLLAYENQGLYIVSADGGDPVKLLDDGPGWHQVVWSPDSQFIAYTAPPAETIFIMDTLGNGKVEIYQQELILPGTLIGWLP